jgi:predicted O-methyltransferase YrrM
VRYWKTVTSFITGGNRPRDPGDPGQLLAPPPPDDAGDFGPPAGEPAELPAAAAPSPAPQVDVRPPGPSLGANLAGTQVTFESVTQALDDAQGMALREYFDQYPATSLMSSRSRAMLFVLIRMLKPEVVAEIGTYQAGGAEVMTRALWANGHGVLHTADPYGHDTAASIIANWPSELRDRIQFHPLNSMEFLIRLRHREVALDFVLIDGDHDYEPVLFDLQMAAQLMRPNGIVVLNDAVQSGPFHAARTFLAANPAWTELGSAIASYDESSPFVGQRVSQADTNFLVLQAPDHFSIGAMPRSWGQSAIAYPALHGLVFDTLPQVAGGTLHYRAILRLFGDGPPAEIKTLGRIEIDLQGAAASIAHALDPPLTLTVPETVENWKCTMEVEVCWAAERGSPPLALAGPPNPQWVRPEGDRAPAREPAQP